MSRVRVAVIGAGVAGLACAQVLTGAGHEVVVLDRGRAVGGRLSSRRLHGRPVDLGASYFTARDPGFAALVDRWVSLGLARPWTDTFHTAGPDGLEATKPGPLRYGAPGGLRSLAEDLASGLDVRREVAVAAVGPGPSVDGTAYDVVVLAMPDPQALRLLDPALDAERTAIQGRAWQPVLALAAGWTDRGWDFDGVFVHDVPELDWVADDGARRGDGAAVLVAHSPAAFAAHYVGPGVDAQAAAAPMTAALRRLLGLSEPEWTSLQRWSYAKPVGTREDLYLLSGAGIGLCGDGWGAAKVEAAWLSGTALGAQLT